MAAETPEGQRLDKWLWHARIIKSRTGAGKLIAEGKVRINRAKALKPSQSVKPGDVLTIVISGRVRVLQVRDVAPRRGPAAEAALLYEDVLATGGDAQDPGAAL
ncbi:MAG: RNA-binding S4 domain-containing protein [Hyphomicrobiales bacterium]|nr:RNA-binding S4 domain-containing protein [Hyphomicrobiales bacterium]